MKIKDLVEDVRSPSDKEYNHASAHVKKNHPNYNMTGIGVSKDHINAMLTHKTDKTIKHIKIPVAS